MDTSVSFYKDKENRIYSVINVNTAPRHIINHFLIPAGYFFDSSNNTKIIYSRDGSRWVPYWFNDDGKEYIVSHSKDSVSFCSESCMEVYYYKLPGGYELSEKELEESIAYDLSLKVRVIIDAYNSHNIIKKVNLMTGEISGIIFPMEDTWDFSLNSYSVVESRDDWVVTPENVDEVVREAI